MRNLLRFYRQYKILWECKNNAPRVTAPNYHFITADCILHIYGFTTLNTAFIISLLVDLVLQVGIVICYDFVLKLTCIFWHEAIRTLWRFETIYGRWVIMKRISSSTALKVELTHRILFSVLRCLPLSWFGWILVTRDVIYFLNEDNQMRY